MPEPVGLGGEERHEQVGGVGDARAVVVDGDHDGAGRRRQAIAAGIAAASSTSIRIASSWRAARGGGDQSSPRRARPGCVSGYHDG